MVVMRINMRKRVRNCSDDMGFNERLREFSAIIVEMQGRR